MLDRELEPEVMDDPQEAQAYDQMDHAAVNAQFVQDFLAGGPIGQDVVDLGTGTAQIPIELCKQDPDCRILASDAAVSMLEIAKLNVAVAGFEHRIQLHHGDSKNLGLEGHCCDSVISNSLIHHLPGPQAALECMKSLVRPRGRIFVRDLTRPDSLEGVEELVQLHASQEAPDCQQLFRQSLIAALSLDEIRSLVAELGFSPDTVQATSDRHWTWDTSA